MSCLWFEWKPIFWNGRCSTKCMKVKRVHLKQLRFGTKNHLSYEMRAQKVKKWVVSDLNGNLFFEMPNAQLNVWKCNGSIWSNFVLGQKSTSVMRWGPKKSINELSLIWMETYFLTGNWSITFMKGKRGHCKQLGFGTRTQIIHEHGTKQLPCADINATMLKALVELSRVESSDYLL